MTKNKRAAGGGRKPLTPTEPTVKVAITLLASQAEAMKQLGDGNLSAGIRKAIVMNTQLAQKFGTVEYEGKTYTLTTVADFSNRVFTGWWGDAQEGEEYIAEFSCPAVDDEGNEYEIRWQFDAVKGNEPEDDSNWPWGDDKISRVIPQ